MDQKESARAIGEVIAVVSVSNLSKINPKHVDRGSKR